MTKDQLVIFAARSGNIRLLRERVAAGGDVNCVDPRYGAPLLAAFRAANPSTVDWLISNGARVNAVYGDGIGPLEIAIRCPMPEVVLLLLHAGARLRRRSRPYYAARLTECLKSAGGAKLQRGQSQRDVGAAQQGSLKQTKRG